MSRAGKPFSVDTHPTKDVVVNGLTKDATVQACIFDLIDNSVDAARDTIFSDREPKDRNELPSSYAGFEIRLTFSSNGFKIGDNCGGIAVDALKKLVMRFGKRSSHNFGIGTFGVGLNRALFKLGKVSHLKTDTGKQRAELILRVDEYLAADNTWELPAEQFESTGNAGTEIEIRQLPSDIASQFADKDWIDTQREEIGRRYGRFIAKGLAIQVQGKPVKNREIRIREDGPYEGEYKFYKTEDGVQIHVQYGQHDDHRFTNERAEYDADKNKQITDQFGWTVFCNDRAILIADRTYKTGWENKFHTEFYGFVGSVSFVGDPNKLPWNTTKTDVDLNNPAYQMALTDMRKFTQKWRKLADQRKKSAEAPRKPPPKKGKPETGKGKPTRTKGSPAKKSKPTVKEDHNQFRTVLPTDVDEKYCFDKHLKLVHECKALDIVENSYTGLVLLRVVVETSISMLLHRSGKYNALRQYAIDERRKSGRKIDAADEKKVLPILDEMLPYLDKNPQVWGAKEGYLKHSLKRMAAHKGVLNSAAHNPFQTISYTVALEIRDEVLPMLRHFIETERVG